MFDYGGWLCPQGDCTLAAGLRRDAVHFSSDPEVQAQIWPVLIEQVLDAVGI